MKSIFQIVLKATLVVSMFTLSACSKTKIDDYKPLEEYIPGDASNLPKDIQVFTSSANASENQPGEDISKALDGNFNTLYHSRWNQTLFPNVPVVIEFHFGTTTGKIDYMLYHPRKDSGVNGFILETEVWIKNRGQQNYEKLGDYQFANSSATKRISFGNELSEPASIKMIVTKGRNDFVSASQFEFFRLNDAASSYAEFFTDLSFSELKSNVKRAQLLTISNDFIRQLALALFDGVYETERTGLYKTYPDPSIIATENKTNRMGSYDNMTGVYARAGEDLVVFVNETQADLVLRIVDHREGYGGPDFFLNPGPNRITSPVNGLAYLIYHSNAEHEAKVNIASGLINGYFDITRHTNEDWQKMIAKAPYEFFDLKGEKAHITFTTAELRQHTSNAVRLIEVYDSIVLMQHQLMGLYKYDRVPTGRLYYRTNIKPGVYMHATGEATEYAPSTLQYIANHSHLRGAHIWGPAHETGHINQTRPGLMWIGMTEVSVNIYSQHVQTSFGNPSRLQTENISGFGNRYEKAFTQIIAPELAHGAHSDVFCKLVPFWQLQMYYAKARNKPDFYKDLHEQIRLNPDPPSDGLCQIEFVKLVCDIAGEDLTEFFEDWGFFRPIDQDINDYGTRRLTVTQQQIDETKAYIAQKGYQVPNGAVQYITDGNLGAFKANNPVITGTANRTGHMLTMNGWHNVAVFEVYHNNQIIHISPRSSFSVPSLPQTITVIAVGVNGSRHTVAF